MHFRILAAVALLALSLTGGAHQHARAQGASSTIIDVPGTDPEMRAAIAKARKSLPEFWKAFAEQAPGTENFSLKIGLPTKAGSGSNAEHIWVHSIVQLDDNKFAAVLANDPRGIDGRKIGDRVEFVEVQISDWMFIRYGRLVGNETLRPLLDRMPRAKADELRAMLERR